MISTLLFFVAAIHGCLSAGATGHGAVAQLAQTRNCTVLYVLHAISLFNIPFCRECCIACMPYGLWLWVCQPVIITVIIMIIVTTGRTILESPGHVRFPNHWNHQQPSDCLTLTIALAETQVSTGVRTTPCKLSPLVTACHHQPLVISNLHVSSLKAGQLLSCMSGHPHNILCHSRNLSVLLHVLSNNSGITGLWVAISGSLQSPAGRAGTGFLRPSNY